ncbi:glycosyl hydrolase family 95 catalytic domain-containing protein [Eubacterium xylanophilum]|uniref:glycosyl hydrolase family 95 catalytic domain-containing protein n=1 Tax=Eubacterium xylanophilum TaxID=39497 RepID=UPI00047E5713|nr:glycoside hydrolase N-terminal domain-containing protein [Eubacterium xylanophilum]
MRIIKRFIKRCAAVFFSLTMGVSSITVSGVGTSVAESEEIFKTGDGTTWKHGIGNAIGFNENTYKTVAKAATNDNWRDGSVTANGEIGFIESCDPKEDVFILNNTKVVQDGTDIYETPVISGILDDQRTGAVERGKFPWINEVAKYARQQYGANWGTTWPRPYQPAAQYRIINNSYTDTNAKKYNRYTNYETGEVGVQWKDDAGNEWNRRSFASREDDVIVTYIEAPEGKDLDVTLTMDHLVEMRNQGTTTEPADTDYVVTKDDKGYGFGMVAKYPEQERKGNKNPKPTKFAYGGWSSATRVVTDGTVDYAADTRSFTAPKCFNKIKFDNVNDPKLTIKSGKSVMLITKVDRIDDGCESVKDVKEKLYDKLIGDITSVIDKYNTTSSEDGYQALLKPHEKIHGGMFRNVKIDLCSTEEEKKQRTLTNSELIAAQNADKNKINKAFLERIYNNGRFGLICASGYGSTRLGAIWNGAFNPDWSGDFTLDANTNLQISGMNTGNMQGAGDGYINFIVRMVEDWVDDATNVYGMHDAIKAPPRVDGTGEAGSYHFIDGYPHIYVNGITDWLIIPIFEYWQCYGNQQIPVGKDIDIDRNKDVLDWSDEDRERIKSTGFMDLEQDILYPMLKKTMNFWLQYVDERYYTDGKGVEHANDGTTISDAIAAGDKDCKYLYTPGYSPENAPKADGENSRGSLAYNTTMDIAASRSTLSMARQLIKIINPSDKKDILKEWAEFEKRIPDYMYASTGELKEWTTPKLEDSHHHRHVSHAYVAWPSYDTQTNEALRIGVDKAMEARSKAFNGKEAAESHGPTHKALVEARLKNPTGLNNVLLYLLTNNYQYTSMMTSHNNNHSSTYCTDSAFGIMGAINESLLYSNTGVVEILPALLEDIKQGSITGLRTRCNTRCDFSWNIDEGKALVTLTSDKDDNLVKVRCAKAWKDVLVNGEKQEVLIDNDGMPYVELNLQKGTAVTVEFALDGNYDRLTADTDKDVTRTVEVGTKVQLSARNTFSRKSTTDVTWHIENAADGKPIEGAAVDADGYYKIDDSLAGKMVKIYAQSTTGEKTNELVFNVAGAEEFNVNYNKEGDGIGVYLANDKEKKDIEVIMAAYDENEDLIEMTAKDVSLDEEDFTSVKMVPTWKDKPAKTYIYVWDKETQTPYTEPFEVE